MLRIAPTPPRALAPTATQREGVRIMPDFSHSMNILVEGLSEEASRRPCPNEFDTIPEFLDYYIGQITELIKSIRKNTLDITLDVKPVTEGEALKTEVQLDWNFLEKDATDYRSVSIPLTPEIRKADIESDQLPCPFDRIRFLAFKLSEINKLISEYKPWYEATPGFNTVGEKIRDLRILLEKAVKDSENPQ